jgi:hypothetical protein
VVFRRGACSLGSTLGVALALAGCGADGGGADGGGAGDGALAEGSSGDGGLSFNVDGRGSSSSTSGVLQVWEGEPAAELSLRGVDAADNLVLFYVTFASVETIAGAHTFRIDPPGAGSVSGIGVMDDQVYYSLRGQLELEMSGDGSVEGRFGMELAFDDGNAPPGGTSAEAIEVALGLSGSFRSAWTVDCRTRLVGFTGGHYTHDSPYCQSLTF